MTLRIHAGWDFAQIGSGIFGFDDSGAGAVITYATGTYCHIGINSVMGGTSYDDFATQLQTALNAHAGLDGTWTVAFSTSTLKYSITCDENATITASTNALACQILGIPIASLPISLTANVAYVSDYQVYYSLMGAQGCRSNDSGIYEPRDVAVDAEDDAGSHYGIAITTAPQYLDFVVPMEAKAATYTRSAVTAVPWTYEHFWKHCRVSEPFAVVDDADSLVLYLRASGASFVPRRQVADWDGAWNLNFATRYKGHL